MSPGFPGDALGRLSRIRRGFQAHRVLKKALPVYEPARKLACSDLSDEEAKAELHDAVRRNHAAAQSALLLYTGRPDTGYVNDRVHRLVAAAVADRPVQPMDPRRAPELEQQAVLGRLPIGEAFERLEASVPELSQLRAAAEAWRRAHPGAADIVEWYGEFRKLAPRVDALVGPAAAGGDALSRSGVARGIVLGYLEMLLGDRRRGDPATPYFRYMLTPVTVEIELRPGG